LAPFLHKVMSEYKNWSQLIDRSWHEGMVNMDEEELKASLVTFSVLAFDSLMWNKDDEPRKIRPSFGTVCPRISYYLQQGKQPAEFPPALSATFTMGHLAHQLCYAALASGLPDEIKADFEVDGSTQFPDTEFHNKKGTADGIFSVREDTDWQKWLPEDSPKSIIVDFKTMVGFAFRDHAKKSFDSLGPDAWGHLRQLSIYANAPELNEKYPGLKDSGALLIGVNKESPVQGTKSRFVKPEVIKEAWDDVQRNVAIHKEDPGAVLLEKHKSNVAFFCGASGRKGYCPYVKECMANR